MREKLALILLVVIGCCFCAHPPPVPPAKLMFVNPYPLCIPKCAPEEAIMAACNGDDCRCVCSKPEKEPM